MAAVHVHARRPIALGLARSRVVIAQASLGGSSGGDEGDDAMGGRSTDAATGIIPRVLHQELADSYMSYAMSTGTDVLQL